MALITEQDVKLNLRLTFVQMLFALTLGEIARQAAILATDEHWSQTHFAAYAHLCLATILVATSWVDTALLAVILLFRSLKQYVDPTEFRAGSWLDRGRRVLWPIVGLILYVGSLIAACLWRT